MRFRRSQAAQHIIDEKVCTEALPAQLPQTSIGLVEGFDRTRAEELELLVKLLVRGLSQQPVIEEQVHRGQHHAAVDVVLHLLVSGVSDPAPDPYRDSRRAPRRWSRSDRPSREMP